MKYFELLIIFYVVKVTSCNASSEDYVDPNNAEDNVFLWKNLFIKLNTMLAESDRLNQQLSDVNQRFQKLEKRLDSQEALLRQTFHHGRQWTTILRRQDGSVDFNRKWNDYSNGFGNPNGDYFMGLQHIHELTTYGPTQELMIILKNFNGQTRIAKYERFRIGNEEQKYALLEVEGYSGDAGNDFKRHKGKKFTTIDQDNVGDNDSRNCARTFSGGWWFYSTCYTCYLNGPYRQANQANTWGVSWLSFGSWDHSLKYAEMMIRPKL